MQLDRSQAWSFFLFFFLHRWQNHNFWFLSPNSLLKTILFISQLTLLGFQSWRMKYIKHSVCFKSKFVCERMSLKLSGLPRVDYRLGHWAVYQEWPYLHNTVIYKWDPLPDGTFTLQYQTCQQRESDWSWKWKLDSHLNSITQTQIDTYDMWEGWSEGRWEIWMW